MSSVAFEEIRAFLGCIHSPSLGHGVEAVEWVECLDMMLCHLLKTSLAKSAKDQTGILYWLNCMI
jgi:hypothetical protein